MSAFNISRGNEVRDINSSATTKVCLEELLSATSYHTIYSLFRQKRIPAFASSRAKHPGSCYPSDVDTWSDLWGGGFSVREKDSQRRRQKAGSGDSGLVDVTLTENREGHVGVSGEPDTQTNPAPPPSPSLTSQSPAFTASPCSSSL